MNDKSLSFEDIETCQKAILDFVPVPVTEKQRQVLERYRAGNLEDVCADVRLCGDYGECLCLLLKAREDMSDAIKHINEAAQFAVKYAGVADGSELYVKLSEALPEYFNENGLASD